ncbi:T9SS type A sorting domain-containing protein [candidate division WOR-3 bacterium]|nr:T9SS type A sorting domain-containing protein [candidate division WOR-3 bacterium]
MDNKLFFKCQEKNGVIARPVKYHYLKNFFLFYGARNDRKVYALFQNYPNPFSKETTFKYSLPKASYVNVSLFDVSGRCIKRLVNERQRPGYYTLRLDGSELNTGIYFVRLQSDNFSLSRKCIIVR